MHPPTHIPTLPHKPLKQAAHLADTDAGGGANALAPGEERSLKERVGAEAVLVHEVRQQPLQGGEQAGTCWVELKLRWHLQPPS